ncbi:MAG: 5-bromo-4-chloroindolyl phosphate hydrolysis family protein [Rhodospirillales bacterium]|nr:5-bromo-4-chloroindolyl phosphate hydrolysis family protein [Rhodospirillales bacterium]
MRGRVIGLLIGIWFAGPIGALIGWWIGSKYDKHRRGDAIARRYGSGDEAAVAAVVALAAKIAKLDGRVAAQEIDTFRRVVPIPASEVPRIAALWDEAKRNPESYEPYARHLAHLFHDRPGMRRRILAILAMVAAADGRTSDEERRALRRIAHIFDLPEAEVDRGLAGGAAGLSGSVHADDVEDAFRHMFDGRLIRTLDTPGTSLFERLRDRLRAACARPGGRYAVAAASAVAAGLAAHWWLPVFRMFPFSEIAVPLVAAAVAGVVALRTLPKPRSLRDEIAAMIVNQRIDPDEVVSVIRESTAKIESLRTAAGSMDQRVRDRVGAICATAASIVDGFRTDPADVARSRPFLAHYLEATGEVLGRYAELRRREPQSARFAEVSGKLEPLLGDIETMFREHYEKTLADDVRELDVSIDTLQRVIRAEGR